MADDNRKRTISEQFEPAISSKRAALGAATGDGSSGGPQYVLKMLCPRECVGNIIGKGGSVISGLNISTGARIKVSQSTEFFPQTNDRVIVITGSKETVAVALTEIITKMIEVGPLLRRPDAGSALSTSQILTPTFFLHPPPSTSPPPHVLTTRNTRHIRRHLPSHVLTTRTTRHIRRHLPLVPPVTIQKSSSPRTYPLTH